MWREWHQFESVRRFLTFALSQAITEDKYVVTQHIREASIVIKNTKEPPLTLTIHLTSPLVREEMERTAAGGKLLNEGCSVLLSGALPPAGRPGRQLG